MVFSRGEGKRGDGVKKGEKERGTCGEARMKSVGSHDLERRGGGG